VDIADELLELVPARLAEEFFLIPVYIQTLDRNNRTLFVAMNDPTDEAALRFVSATAGMPVKPMVAGPSDITAAIHTYYYGEDESEYTPPGIHTSQLPPSPTATVPAEQFSFVPITAGADSEPPVFLSDDEIEHIDDESEQRISEMRSVSLAELTESSAPPPPVAPDGELRDIEEMVENRYEEEELQQQAQRQVEKHMFGLGLSKHRGMSLTLLDGTTIDFGGANQKRKGKGESEKDRLLRALRAAASGKRENGDLPAENWEAFMAALLDVLFRKHLVFPEEFLRALGKTE
jgi:type IV pilus assembly protein PilB